MRPGIALLLVVDAVGLVHCGGARPAGEPAPAPTTTVGVPPASAASPERNASEAAGAPVASDDAGAPGPAACEGQRHLTTPAAGFGNDRPFTVVSAVVTSQATGDYASLDFDLGSHADTFAARDAYRGVNIRVFADAPTLTIVPGTYPIPHWEKKGPIWDAMIRVSSQVGLGSNDRGELVIDEITAAKGKTPATVSGHLWICVDPIAEYPGPQWIGGTFTATVNPLDTLRKVRAAFTVQPGKIIATRPKTRQ